MGDNNKGNSTSELYNQATGMPVSTGTGVLAFTGSAGNYPDVLTPNETYLVQCTEACHINFEGTSETHDPIYFAYVPYVVHLPLRDTDYTASVIRSTSSGNIYISHITPDRL